VFGQILGFSIGITPVLGAFGALGLAIEGGALAVGGLSKAVGFVGGTGLVGSLGSLSGILTTVIPLWLTWNEATKLGTSLYENNTYGIRDMADAAANWIGKMITGKDVQGDINKLVREAAPITEEMKAKWTAYTDSLKATPDQVETKFGISVSEGQNIMDFIIKNSDAGATGTEILTKLKAEYADTETGKLIDWAQVEEEIKKWIGLEIRDPAAIQAELAAVVKANQDGIVSFPARLDMDTAQAALAVNQLILEIERDWNDVGLTINTPELSALKAELKKIAEDSANDWNIAFQGVGGDMVTNFNAVTGEIEYTFVHTANSIKDTIATAAKTEIDDVYKAALEKKETIEAALEYRANVDIKGFEEQTKQIEIKAETLQKALEFQFQIDMKQLENLGKSLDTISLGLETSASIIQKSLDSLVGISDEFGALSPQMKAATESIISETENRVKLTDSLVEINKAQADYLKAKTDLLKSGDSLIKIEMDGVEPELEMIMWKIIERVQLRATENMDDFLLGIG